MGIAQLWRGGRVLYYRYAPPASYEGEFRDEVLPERPYPGCAPFERSVYYYWWAFLRGNRDYLAYCENGGEGPMASLYHQFGDVRGNDFLEWWASIGRLLFCEPLERMVRVHEPDLNGRVALENAGDQLIVTFPKDGDLPRILAEVKARILAAQNPLLETAESQARFPVERNPVLSALHKRLTVWKLRRANPDAALHSIAQMAGLKFSYRGDNPTQRGIVALKYHKEAECLIKYVGQGRFPVYNEKQGANPKPGPKKPFKRARIAAREVA
jgi:hypothetical protein